MIFIVGTTDYSANVVSGSYKVNNDPVYNEWTDGNGIVHRQKVRDKVVGSFDMFFRSLSDYNDFLTVLNNATSDEQTLLTVSVNNTGANKASCFFVSHDPVRNLDGSWSDYMEQFTLNITEA